MNFCGQYSTAVRKSKEIPPFFSKKSSKKPPLRVAVQSPQIGRFPAEQAGPEHPLSCFTADICRDLHTHVVHALLHQPGKADQGHWVPRLPCLPLLMPREGQTPLSDIPTPSWGAPQGQPRALLVGAQATLKSQGPTISAWLPSGRVGQPGVQLSHHRDLLRCPHQEG